ncbi:hydroxypyruvate isomerase [Naumannella cuiyingiana]|uniref:Hydroxypyruvate isomerase n=1 Tax=Naumannella cuiyingiana TaxID=1347891 RepID=A0A7Z0D825_9ACTN|nr:TIM barrel protein [Naumannella cuiyingiana]NYI70660.1 hydroxypyruvate isomerase [Naumannella cuiyingiana]
MIRFDVNCSILFTELPLLERPAAARAAGFDAIELWWPFADAVPAQAEIDALVRAIEEAGVTLVGLNFAAGDMPGGDRGLFSWPRRATELRDNIDVALGIGERLGCRAFNALYGNRIDDVRPEAQDELAVENLALAAERADRFGGVILVEPVSGAPRYPLRTAADALAVVDAAGRDNVAILADLYHLAVNGDDVEAVIDTHTDRIGHVQVADAPGRHQPGTGTLPLAAQLAALQAAGYVGNVGLEYIPDGPSERSFGWLTEEFTTKEKLA